MLRRRTMIARWGALSILGSMTAGQARSADFPNKAMRLVVPFPPGGGTDVIARTLANKVGKRLGQSIIVDNKSGGNGFIAQRELAAAPADGHTLLMDSMAITVFPHLMKRAPMNTMENLDPIARLGTFPFVIIVNPNVPAQNVKELIDYLGKDSMANVASAGATTRLAAELFRLESGVDMTFISYRGGAPTMVAMISGESHVYFGDVPTVINHIKSGRVRAIAVTSRNRLSILPDVPTVAESGFPSYEFASWNGLYSRKGTPRDILTVLNREFTRASNEPDVLELLTEMGSRAETDSVDEFKAFHKSQYDHWKDVIQRSKMPMID